MSTPANLELAREKLGVALDSLLQAHAAMHLCGSRTDIDVELCVNRASAEIRWLVGLCEWALLRDRRLAGQPD